NTFEDARRELLTPAHMYMFDIMADRLSLEPAAVEDFILDSTSLDACDTFFAQGGSRTISFVYQEAEIPGIGLSITQFTCNLDELFLANLSQTCLRGKCCFFTRTQIFFNMVDGKDGLLKGIKDTFSSLLPALDAEQHWGVLNKSRHGEKFKKNFMFTINNCLRSLDGKYTFKRVVLNVLLEVDQLRRLDGSAGPLSELEHWKQMSLKFDSVLNHIQSSECKAVVKVLCISKSKTMKMWRELDAKATDRVNEAKDNVKFLSTLENVCQPLYNSDPVSMIKSVHNVFNAIHMIYNVSRYYNTDEKIAILFGNVTNQMLNACRAYITENGKYQIWDHNPENLTRKMQVMTIDILVLINRKCIMH
uniref:Dynein heavy chain tail domain-containing protein n=1 Tax=Neogobius melanostomus TaxID=47308 RepID=A0A8C6U862_9GOBI